MFEPEVETRDPTEQRAIDETLFRKQIAYLYENSPFYRAKLADAGFADAEAVGGLDDLADLPFTTKDELRQSQADTAPLGAHCAAPLDKIARIYSSSGTSGAPMYIPLTYSDLIRWIRTSQRTYTAAGIRPHHRVLTTYNSGPFVAGAVGESLQALGVNLVPIGTGNTDRLITALDRFRPNAMPGTPSFLAYIAETARARGIDPAACGLETLVCGGEPGASEPAVRQQLEQAFGARVHEVMGIGDISISIWGEGPEQAGMHFCAQGFVHVELIDPDTSAVIPLENGASGELVYTHLQHEAAPLLRFRSRDHVVVSAGPVPSGRTGVRVRCIGRTDDMLIVRGVNVFPSAIREVVSTFAPTVGGMIAVRPTARGVKQSPPLPVAVELAEGVEPEAGLAAAIETAIRERLIFTAQVELVAAGTLARSEYKSRLVDYTSATDG
ncbi:MAG: AMP-binding protein [Alphaproteobacteria bacterium]|nr:AMP-binding protein [Alphaproteobacteria bacterium]